VDVERMIHALDGKTHCEVFIGDRTTTEGLNVIGGPNRFVTWVQRWDAAKLLVIDTAFDPLSPPGTVRYTLSNGQVEEIPTGQTVDLQSVLQAASTFFEGRGLAPDLEWTHQG
jgi:hypothetical protein